MSRAFSIFLSKRPLAVLVTVPALVAMAAGVISTTANAAATVPFSIGATLVPASCDVLLSQETLDFGEIPASSLSETVATKLPARDVTVTVSCKGVAASVALAMTDNRQGSESRDSGNPALFGVGMYKNKAVGNFSLTTGNAVADGVAADPIARVGAGGWNRLSGELSGASDFQLSWAQKGTTVPGTYTTRQQTFAVTLEIAAKNNLPSTGEGIPIDGSMTFSVVYL